MHLNGSHQICVIVLNRLGQNKISNPLFIQNGVPQGSILGPILFLICFNDIFLPTKDTSATLILYVNDSTCVISVDSIDTALSNMKQFINSLHKWFKVNKVKLYFSKTIFYFVQKPYYPSL